MTHRGVVGMVKVSLFDATAGQPSKMLSTNHVPLPGSSLRSSCVSVVTPIDSNGAPFMETQTRYSAAASLAAHLNSTSALLVAPPIGDTSVTGRCASQVAALLTLNFTCAEKIDGQVSNSASMN